MGSSTTYQQKIELIPQIAVAITAALSGTSAFNAVSSKIDDLLNNQNYPVATAILNGFSFDAGQQAVRETSQMIAHYTITVKAKLVDEDKILDYIKYVYAALEDYSLGRLVGGLTLSGMEKSLDDIAAPKTVAGAVDVDILITAR